MVDYANLFWLVLAALIAINACLFVLVYLWISDKKEKSRAGRGSVAEGKATHECRYFVGYLAAEHPRSKPIPRECFGCTFALECMNKPATGTSELVHGAPDKDGGKCDECSRPYTVTCVVCGKQRCKQHADVFEIITEKETMQLYMCLRCRSCQGYVCTGCYEQTSSRFGRISLVCKKCGQKLAIEPVSLSERGDRWNKAEFAKLEILEA